MPTLLTRTELPWNTALQAAQAAMQHADELGIRIHVSVVDQSGLELTYLRHNGAFLHSADIARDKAYTAASFGFSTQKWLAILEANPAMHLGFPQRERLVVFGGGLPIHAEGQRIGGIGVSGGSEAEDEACARAGLQAIGLDVTED